MLVDVRKFLGGDYMFWAGLAVFIGTLWLCTGSVY